MQPSRPRPDLLLVLKRVAKHSVAELTASVCYRYDPTIATGTTTQADPGEVLTPIFGSSGIYDQYAELLVHAYIDTSGITTDGSCWGWGYEYRSADVDLARARTMTATLQRLGRQLAALDAQLGRPGVFADYLTRFATALGISRYAVYSRQLHVDGTHWMWLDADQMRIWIAHHEPPHPRPWR